MTQFGYTAMGEQAPVRQLITDLVAAEAAGFDFSVISDHYFPWLEEQGHSPDACSFPASRAARSMLTAQFKACSGGKPGAACGRSPTSSRTPASMAPYPLASA